MLGTGIMYAWGPTLLHSTLLFMPHLILCIGVVWWVYVSVTPLGVAGRRDVDWLVYWNICLKLFIKLLSLCYYYVASSVTHRNMLFLCYQHSQVCSCITGRHTSFFIVVLASFRILKKKNVQFGCVWSTFPVSCLRTPVTESTNKRLAFWWNHFPWGGGGWAFHLQLCAVL